MDIFIYIINYLLTIILIILIYLIIKYYKNKTHNLEISLAKIKSEKISQSTKYGQISEEFFPLEQSYPYNSQHFKFLGDPIDGIQFNENEIVLIEFKTNKSQLSQKQRNIRDLVKDKKVSFELIEAKI
ncbi:MAG: Holliday junction resolvase-like protein [Dehalococcoidia bacterium]